MNVYVIQHLHQDIVLHIEHKSNSLIFQKKKVELFKMAIAQNKRFLVVVLFLICFISIQARGIKLYINYFLILDLKDFHDHVLFLLK